MSSIIDTLITDRTQADVDRAQYLNSLWDAKALQWRGTPQERAEWEAGPRGAYGFADMNRVSQAAAFLIGELSALGYSVDIEDVTPAYTIRLSADPANGGGVSGGGVLYQGDTAVVSARPGDKYDFVGWKEAGKIVSAETPYAFTVERSRNLTAIFALKQFRVSVSVDPPESGEGAGAGTYDIDTEVTVAATAGDGYAFTRWQENGQTVSEDPEYTFTLDRDRSLTAVMVKTYVISVSASDIDGGAVTGGGIYLEGQTVSVAAVPEDGYAFTGWTENGVVVSTDAVYSFTASADRELTAQLVKTHVITLAVDPAGGGSASGGGTFPEGEQITVTAAPESDYRFVAWMDGTEQVSSSASYTFTVTDSRTLTAAFEELPVYTITALVSPEGWGIVAGAGQYRDGASVTLTAVPGDGYEFSSWQENGQAVSTSETYTFTADGNRALIASFSVASRLPKGYTELEYIESSGTQYIDTGVIPVTANTKVVMSVELPADQTNSTERFFGVYAQKSTSSTNSQVSAFGMWRSKSTGRTYAVMKSASGSNPSVSGATVMTGAISGKTDIVLDGPSGKAAVGSTSVTVSTGAMYSSVVKSIYLLAQNNVSGSTASANGPMIAKVYSCQIFDKDSLVRDFVPCKNPSGAVGLYDLIGGTFYENSGTGAFAAGPAI